MKRPKFIVKELCTSGVLTVNSSDVTVVYFIQYGKFKHWLICNIFRTALVWSITQRTAVSNDPEERSSRPLCWQKTEITFICFCLPWNRFLHFSWIKMFVVDRVKLHIYRVIQEESALLWDVIVWVILSKKVHMNMGPILNGYRVMAAWNLE